MEVTQVTENVERQEQLVAEIQERHQAFIAEKGGAGSNREDALKALAREHRFNLDGEGGEFETVVLCAPHMRASIECDAESLWHGSRGVWNVESACLRPLR